MGCDKSLPTADGLGSRLRTTWLKDLEQAPSGGPPDIARLSVVKSTKKNEKRIFPRWLRSDRTCTMAGRLLARHLLLARKSSKDLTPSFLESVACAL